MTLDDLYATIMARKTADPETSWTAKLLAKGPEKCAEAADVLYHLLVMMAARDVPLADVLAELDRRQNQSGIAEKAGRTP